MLMNLFCEIVVEEVVRLKEKGVVIEIVVVMVGFKVCQEQLCNVMVLGVDCGIYIECDVFFELL